jgi:chromosome segregation ATPase
MTLLPYMRELIDARAEIERLQAHAKSMIDALNTDIDAKAAEIERLTAALGSAGYARALKECDDLRAEIDRLQADRAQLVLMTELLRASNAEVERLRRHRTELDCRYTMGDVADLSGSHCPPDEPCLRCKVERLTADGQRRIEENDRILVANARLRAENERLLTENAWLQGSNDRLQMNLRHAVLKYTKP